MSGSSCAFNMDRLLVERIKLDCITLQQGKGLAQFDPSISNQNDRNQNLSDMIVQKDTLLKIPIYIIRRIIQFDSIAVILPKFLRPTKDQFLLVDPPIINTKKLGFQCFYSVLRFFYGLLQKSPKLCMITERKKYVVQPDEIKIETKSYILKLLTQFWRLRRINILEQAIAAHDNEISRKMEYGSKFRGGGTSGGSGGAGLSQEMDNLKQKLSLQEEFLLNRIITMKKENQRYFRIFSDAPGKNDFEQKFSEQLMSLQAEKTREMKDFVK